jgi:hypothetical protein
LLHHTRGLHVVEVFSDQGGEFDNTKLRAFWDELGIVLEFTNAYSPQENGIVDNQIC